MTKTIQLDEKFVQKYGIPVEELDQHIAQYPNEPHLVIREDCRVLKPDGSLLVHFRKGALTEEEALTLHNNARSAARWNSGRAAAGGPIEVGGPGPHKNTYWHKTVSPYAGYYTYADGRKCKMKAGNKTNSGVIGYSKMTGRYGSGTQLTSWAKKKPKKYERILPILQKVSRLFEELEPDRYQVMARHVAENHPKAVIPETVFSTITVNRDFQTGLHRDKGNYKEGVATILVTERPTKSGETFTGFFLVFPQYGVGIDLRCGDLAVMDNLEYHGNSHYEGDASERMSYVCFIKENLTNPLCV